MGAMFTAGRRVLALTAVVLVAVTAAGAASADPVTGSAANGTYLALGDWLRLATCRRTWTPRRSTSMRTRSSATPNISPSSWTSASRTRRVRVNDGEHVRRRRTEQRLRELSGLAHRLPTLYPLHVQYQGTQMEYALHYLAAHKHTRLVTIDIGANDAFVCQATTLDHCSSLAELLGVASTIAANLGTIFHQLRDTAGYDGPLVALTYYSLSYTDPAQVAGAVSSTP